MRRTLLKLVVTTLVILPISFKSYAWNSVGHMAVADIAYQQLNETAKAKVDKFVLEIQKEYPEITTFAQLAYWPDTLRGQKIELFSHWHYIDYSFSLDGTPTKFIIDTDNAVWALNTIKLVLKNEHANPIERARFLGFFAHITGDLHQPLHTVSYFSSDFPGGDQGGNQYKLSYKGGSSNMHSIWDEGLGVFAGDSKDDRVKTVSNSIMAKYPKAYFGAQADDVRADTWTSEGVDNAKTVVYSTALGKAVSEVYIEQGQQLAEREVALAGYRLGLLLNQLLS